VSYSSTFACVFLHGTSFTFGTMDINFNANRQLRKGTWNVNWRWKFGSALEQASKQPVTTYWNRRWDIPGWNRPVPKYIYHPSFMVHRWEMNAMMSLNMYRLQAPMSTYTYSLSLEGKLFLRACPVAVIEWHVHYILDELVNYCST
jgi:hypothetical protein